MERIKTYESYINESFSFTSLFKNIGKKIKKAKNLAVGIVDIIKNKAHGRIPSGPKKGKPVIQYYPYTGPGSITSALSKEYPNDSMMESATVKMASLDSLSTEASATSYDITKARPETGIRNVYGDELIEKLRENYKCLLNGLEWRPLFIYGGPGIGKTKIVGQIAEEMEGSLIDLSIMHLQPEDFIGVPSKVEINGETIDAEGLVVQPNSGGKVKNLEDIGQGVTRHNIPVVFPNDPLSKGVIFFDEANTAQVNVLSSLLNFVAERRIGDYYLPDGWLIIGAGNRKEDVTTKGLIKEMGIAFNDRWEIVNYVPTVESFVHHVKTHKGRILADSDAQLKDIVLPELLRFLMFTEKAFYTLNPNLPGMKFANPRDWVEASADLYSETKRLAAKNKGPVSRDRIEEIFSQYVGSTTAKLFINFYELCKQINPDEIDLVFTNPDKAPLPTRTVSGLYKEDIMFAILSAILTRLENMGEINVEQFTNILKWCMRLDDSEYAKMLLDTITVKMFPDMGKAPASMEFYVGNPVAKEWQRYSKRPIK